MAGYGFTLTCNRCDHECHCDNLVCSHPVGVGGLISLTHVGVVCVNALPTVPTRCEIDMWFFLISSIASSIIGSAADSWFSETKMGIQEIGIEGSC